MGTRHTITKTLKALRLNRVAANLYYRYVHGFASAKKAAPAAVERCLRKAIELKTAEVGDYYEFGVFKGRTFLEAQRSANRLGLRDMRFFGFDSFAGLPPIDGADDPDESFYEGQYACSKPSVVANLDRCGFDWSRGALIEGYFERSLTPDCKQHHGMDHVAVALIDGDLYSSAVQCLQFIEDMVVDGTILILDDWQAYNQADDRGERRAFAEFLARHSDYSAEEFFEYGSPGTRGKVFILHTEGMGARQEK